MSYQNFRETNKKDFGRKICRKCGSHNKSVLKIMG